MATNDVAAREKGACWRFFRSIGRATHVVTDVGP